MRGRSKTDLRKRRQAEVLRLREREGMSFRQIGKALGVSTNTASADYRDAVRMLGSRDNPFAPAGKRRTADSAGEPRPVPTPAQWRKLTAAAFQLPGWVSYGPLVYGLESEVVWEDWLGFARMILELDARLRDGS